MKDDVIHYASRSESEAIQFNAIHELSPVNICSNHPPIQVDAKINRQYCRIVNQSATDLDYIIDTDNISRVNAQNFNFKIFQCLKSSGCLPAGGIEYLEIVFQPLEEKTYELKLPITVNGGIPRLITIRGQGVLYENLKKNEEYLDRTLLDNFINYSYKLTSQPKSIASISKKTLSFGHVPIFATLRQIFVVTNKSKHDTITVSWIIPAVFSTNGKLFYTNFSYQCHSAIKTTFTWPITNLQSHIYTRLFTPMLQF